MGGSEAEQARLARRGRTKDGEALARVRLARILARLLSHGRTTRAALEAELGADKRAVGRDLVQLAEAGLVRPVGAGPHRAYEVAPELLQRALPALDRLALVVGQQATRFLEDTPLHRPQSGLADLEAVVRYVPEPARTYGHRAALVRTCLDAVLGGRGLRLRYDGRHGPQDWAGVEASHLLVYRRSLYVLVRNLGREKPYALALDRIVHAELLEPLERRRPFDVDAWLHGRFGLTSDPEHEEPEEVVLRFTHEVAVYVRERAFHPGAKVEPCRSGVRLTMAATGRELVAFVLQWGPHVEVESPPWLRDRVVDELRRALATYERASHPAAAPAAPEPRP